MEMKDLILTFTQQLEEAFAIASNAEFKKPNRPINNIVICGLGGSGIGAKIVSNWLQDELTLPLTLVNEYTLPAFVGPNTLVIGSSYSGNTEETTMALDEAQRKGAFIFCISSGGQLAQFCANHGHDCVIVPGGNPPRSALAYSLVQLVNYFHVLGFISEGVLLAMRRSISFINSEQSDIQKKAQEMSDYLYGKVGVFYGETKYEGVIVRARQQFNENSKYLGWSQVIPEMNHNELVGWGGGDERFAPVFFVTEDVHPRNKKRFEITMNAVKRKSNALLLVESKGESLVERSLYLIHLVDWASFYLCERNGVDIMDIEIIDYLKSELGKMQ
jgi:glucose/mannose-6-phosphate isomerase